jgi:recombination protein RecA
MAPKEEKDKGIKITPMKDIADILSSINSNLKVTAGMHAEDANATDSVYITKYSSGILSLDAYLGVGGLLGGRMMNAWGWEGSGKTLMAYTAIAAVQAAGGKAAFLDAEGTFAHNLAVAVGVNCNDLMLFRSTPERILTGEDYFAITNMLVQSGVDIVVIDSVPAMIPASRLTAVINQGQKAVPAQMMSEGLSQVNAYLNAARKSVVWLINQIRAKPMVMFGPTEDHTGGSAIKFYASYSLELKKEDDIVMKVKTFSGSVEERKVGVTVRARLHKNKTAAIPEKPIFFDIYFTNFTSVEGVDYTAGVDVYKDMVVTAINCGVIVKASSWFSWDDIKTNGEVAFIKELRTAGVDKVKKLREAVLVMNGAK